jgi:hypothetical protein
MPFGIATTRHLSHHATSVPAFGQHGTIAGFFGALGGSGMFVIIHRVKPKVRAKWPFEA